MIFNLLNKNLDQTQKNRSISFHTDQTASEPAHLHDIAPPEHSIKIIYFHTLIEVTRSRNSITYSLARFFCGARYRITVPFCMEINR
jgi:hypothetical protein